ncbi:MAG: PKD domain-containing protein [Candidatus Omnitrophica bacterium]|nr:PKD domain-containing protein [Candidatus Omnitrophota bacterium]
MRKAIILFLLFIFLPGCATYKFQYGRKPYEKGYVVSRDDYVILEYTVGKDKSLPDKIALARDRFERRRKAVEHYYKQMGYVENHFKALLWNPCIYTVKLVGGAFRLPFIIVSDYRYQHNPKYKEKIDAHDAQKEAREEARMSKIREELNAYINEDVAVETKAPAEAGVTRPKAKKPVMPRQEKPKRSAEKKATVTRASSAALPDEPVAIIIAKPSQGLSPLRVRFSGNKSYAAKKRIVSYSWDFGDGETSQKVNPVNTYYSSTFTPRYFTVTLTVRDEKGNSATATTKIEVLNK